MVTYHQEQPTKWPYPDGCWSSGSWYFWWLPVHSDRWSAESGHRFSIHSSQLQLREAELKFGCLGKQSQSRWTEIGANEQQLASWLGRILAKNKKANGLNIEGSWWWGQLRSNEAHLSETQWPSPGQSWCWSTQVNQLCFYLLCWIHWFSSEYHPLSAQLWLLRSYRADHTNTWRGQGPEKIQTGMEMTYFGKTTEMWTPRKANPYPLGGGGLNKTQVCRATLAKLPGARNKKTTLWADFTTIR